MRPIKPAPASAAGDCAVEKSFLRIAEVAAWLGVHERTVRRRIKDGSIRKAPLGGGAVRISMAEMARLSGTTSHRDAMELSVNPEKI